MPTLASFITPPGQLALARSILLHCAQTFRLNPDWINYQKQMDAYALQYQQARQQNRMAQLAQQIQQFDAQMQAMRSQVSAFESHQNAEVGNSRASTTPSTASLPPSIPLPANHAMSGLAHRVATGPTAWATSSTLQLRHQAAVGISSRSLPLIDQCVLGQFARKGDIFSRQNWSRSKFRHLYAISLTFHAWNSPIDTVNVPDSPQADYTERYSLSPQLHFRNSHVHARLIPVCRAHLLLVAARSAGTTTAASALAAL